MRSTRGMFSAASRTFSRMSSAIGGKTSSGSGNPGARVSNDAFVIEPYETTTRAAVSAVRPVSLAEIERFDSEAYRRRLTWSSLVYQEGTWFLVAFTWLFHRGYVIPTYGVLIYRYMGDGGRPVHRRLGRGVRHRHAAAAGERQDHRPETMFIAIIDVFKASFADQKPTRCFGTRATPSSPARSCWWRRAPRGSSPGTSPPRGETPAAATTPTEATPNETRVHSGALFFVVARDAAFARLSTRYR